MHLSFLYSDVVLLTLSLYGGFPVGAASFGCLEKKTSEKIDNLSIFYNIVGQLLQNYWVYS